MGMSFEEYERIQFAKLLDAMRPPFFKQAACRGNGLAAYFPGQGQSSLMKKAIETCKSCPVREDCFIYAFKNRIEHGVWGGTSAEERIALFGIYYDAKKAWDFKISSD
jgi:WhiB family transcriptional regulator, redox-sensing transcriptional regulator